MDFDFCGASGLPRRHPSTERQLDRTSSKRILQQFRQRSVPEILAQTNDFDCKVASGFPLLESDVSLTEPGTMSPIMKAIDEFLSNEILSKPECRLQVRLCKC